ncbi:hypothetical protein LCGC14_2048360 [marine sediment metagenome]|uniref:Uncharacterized protein n=1 Tax=marine sediment metagenome TaxID=412755 RepID=A0A0F9FC96_9ZZZZ
MTIQQLSGTWYEGTHVYFTDIGATASGKTRTWEVLPNIQLSHLVLSNGSLAGANTPSFQN